MLDDAVRRRLGPRLEPVAAALDRRGVTPGSITAGGLLVGVAACVAAALAVWVAALVLWLINRSLDGLDGTLARRRAATGRAATSSASSRPPRASTRSNRPPAVRSPNTAKASRSQPHSDPS